MKKQEIYLLSSLVAVFMLDLATKMWSLSKLQEPFTIITDFFSFRYAENTGIAFSIPVSKPLLILATIFILIAVIHTFVKPVLTSKNSHDAIVLGAFIAGALGNLFDRLTRGFVIDFIAVGTFPVFNIADIAITLSVLYFAYATLIQKRAA